MRNRWFLVAILLATLAVAAGCGNGSDPDDDSGDDQDAAPTAIAQPTEAAFDISNVIWTSGVDDETGEPLDEVENFTTVSPQVVAVVRAENVPAGTGFTATWTIDGIEVPEATMDVTVDDDMSTAWITFEFIRAEGRYFPLGTLEVTVTATTGESIQGSVRIELP